MSQILFVCSTNVAPLVYIERSDNSQSPATVVGIASWVAACGDVNYPDIFARVTHALQWILDKTGNLIFKYFYLLFQVEHIDHM